MDAPALARDSVRALLHLPVGILCSGHGEPLVGNAVDALREALATDTGEARPGPSPNE